MADLADLARRHLEAAHRDEHGRSAELVLHDGVLRQTVIALRAGAELGEHNSPHAASVQVLHGSVTVTGTRTSPLRAGQLAVLEHARHSVRAEEDAVFLLTTVTGLDPRDVPAEGPSRDR
ncbi:cupin [Cellulomonas endophytica]|uniref:cupin n=1 Tax=Cellulomonas endophytica TaxID=2494735 RepID=UPI00101364A6|nr:cupin [Cellulomonas endophytica]